MPHLPIEIEGGSLTVRFPGTEGAKPRIEERARVAADTIPASSGHAEVRLDRYSESDRTARIYLIEIFGSDKTRDPIKYTPNDDGSCLIRVHYVAGDEAKEPIPADLTVGAKPLG